MRKHRPQITYKRECEIQCHWCGTCRKSVTLNYRDQIGHNGNGSQKVWILDIALFTGRGYWTAAFYNLGSGSWLAWASDTAARYAANSRDSGQVDPRLNTTDIPPPQSAALCLHLVARRLLLINRPRMARWILKKYILWVNAVVLWRKKIVLRIFNYIFSLNFLLL